MKKFHVIIIILITLLTLFLLYNKLAFMNIIVKFDELEPFEKQMAVYFKGFRIGKTTKIYPDKDYQNTYLKLRLYRGKVNLPSNSTVKIRKIKAGSYVDVLYPNEPTLSRLKDNDEIKGTISKDIAELIENKLNGGELDLIVDDTANLIENANTAIVSLNEIFIQVRDTIEEIRPDIVKIVSNFADTSSNLKNTSETINLAINSDNAKTSFLNITDTTENIKLITENIEDITKQIDDVTMPITNSVLCETQQTMKNVNEISFGLKNTLKKQFGFGRLIFGRPVSCD